MRHNKKAPHLSIRELTERQDFLAMYPLIRQLNRDLSKNEFQHLLVQMLSQGYRAVGAFSQGRLVGVSGFWVGHRFWCRKFIDLDNVVVERKLRGNGIGKKLVAWVEREARRLRCQMMGLDSYTTAHPAHGFYFRRGYCILGYHFIKQL